jgi:diguanylate cyclase (GGDEF)-like protein
VTDPGGTILIVDDERRNRRLLEALLAPEGYVTRTASSGVEALASVAESAPDLILLDVMMPGMSGHEVATTLKEDPATRSIPIIMVTAQTDRDARLAALDAGAEEFLTKPVDRAELWLRVRNLLRLKSLSDLLANHQSRLEAEVMSRTSDLHHLAHYDSLTGLPNRTLFYQTLASTLERATSHGWTVAVLFIDLDHFKNVNDTLGHGVGDELLVEVSGRLRNCVRMRDTVGRLGGDEFALIVIMRDGPQMAAVIAGKVQEALRAPFELQGHELSVTASIGITAHPDDATDPETLIKYADTAMYQAKQSGRDTFRFFTAQMNAEALERLELETALRRAVKCGEFVVHYQPKVLVDSGRVSGVEALLRWDRPGKGLVAPEDFIPALEESGLIVEVGRWVISAVCDQIAAWQTAIGPVQVSVNVSSRQFVDSDLERDVVQALEASGIPAGLLEMELTESTLMANTARTIAILETMRARGVQISIDDFGTGYSSLAYLRRFPIDKLKIDKGFIRHITTDPDDAAIAVAIIRMAHSLNLDVIAEGVETAAQLQYLRRHRCDQMQGYLFSRPLPAPELERLLLTTDGVPTTEATASRSTLLLVDADRQALDDLLLLLEGDGLRILTAESAADALEVLALDEPQVILCAQRLPDTSGTELLHRVKELHPDPLRLMLSVCTDQGTLVDAINHAEVYRYYQKPWDAELLRVGLRDAFRHYWRLHDAAAAASGLPVAPLRLVDKLA